MRKQLLQTRRSLRFLAIVLFSILLAACGGEDADEDPTATSAASDAQPTVESGASTPVGTSVPTNVDMSAVEPGEVPGEATPGATPEVGDAAAEATPISTEPAATPSIADLVTSATPVDGAGTTGAVTPEVDSGAVTDDAIPADADVGDGTTGALIPTGADAATPGAPAATPLAGSATPDADASPVASLTVTGCEVADVPSFTGEVTAHRLTTDLNFRAGPGAECELALPDPIGAFMVVEVTGGPVIREDDGSEWVRIETLGTQGWVAYEFLEPVEE